jgi:hypothetical protein
MLAFVVLGISTIGAHAESIEYNLRVFEYYLVALMHGDSKNSD